MMPRPATCPPPWRWGVPHAHPWDDPPRSQEEAALPACKVQAPLATVLFLLLFGLLSLAACATSWAHVFAQLELPPAPAPRIEPRSIETPTLDPALPGAAPIEGRPASETPPLSVPPLGSAALLPSDAERQALQRELHRLMRQAASAQPVGSTVVSAQAAWHLGLVYLHGAGVRHDTAQAQRWFEQAARFGREPWAYAGLAWCHIEGCVGPPDPAAAARAIAQLRASHPARADYLAWVLARRQPHAQATRPGLAPPPPSQGADAALLRKAAAAGDLHARIEMGLESVSQGRPDQAEQFFRQAAGMSPAATYNLREIRARGNAPGAGSAQGTESADAAAALEQARKYHRGEGVPANFSEAIRFYRLAEQRGSAQARRMLALIHSRPDPSGGINILWMQQLARADPASVGLVIGSPVTTHQLLREPTPLADLMLPFWRRQLAPVG